MSSKTRTGKVLLSFPPIQTAKINILLKRSKNKTRPCEKQKKTHEKPLWKTLINGEDMLKNHSLVKILWINNPYTPWLHLKSLELTRNKNYATSVQNRLKTNLCFPILYSFTKTKSGPIFCRYLFSTLKIATLKSASACPNSRNPEPRHLKKLSVSTRMEYIRKALRWSTFQEYVQTAEKLKPLSCKTFFFTLLPS